MSYLDQKRRSQSKTRSVSATNPLTKNPIYEGTIYDTIPGGDYGEAHQNPKGSISIPANDSCNRYTSEPKNLSEMNTASASEQYVYMESLNKNKNCAKPSNHQQDKLSSSEDGYMVMKQYTESALPKSLPPLEEEMNVKDVIPITEIH